MRGNYIVLQCMTALSVLISVFGNPENLPYPKKVVEGIYAKEVEGSVVYDAVIPLVYEFEVPFWSREDVVIHRSQNCTSTNFTKSSTCPVMHFLPEIHDRFSSYLEMAQPFGQLFDGESGKIQRIDFNCDEIAPHFNGNLFYSQETIDNYMKELEKCPAKEFERIPGRNYNYNISGIYVEMRAGFYKNYWMEVHDGHIDAALWSNAIKSLNSLIFNNYYMESNRWKLAVSDCKAGRIPSTLITTDVLKDSLNLTFDKVSQKYVPVFHIRDLPEYFTSALTDCTFTDKSSFVVRILIPMQSRNASAYKVSKLSTAPFIQQDETENTTFICEIRKSSNYVLVDQLRNIAYETDCTGKGPCKAPKWTDGLKVDSCASALISSSYNGIVRYCDLHCEEISQWQISPVARRIDTDKFVLAMNPHSTATVSLQCPGSKDRNLKSVDVGAVQIKLPCNCRIHSNSEVIRINTCDASVGSGDPSVYHTVPFHWINEKRLQFLDSNKPTDMSFRPSGLVIRATTKKYANVIKTDTIRADKVSGSGNGTTGGSSNGVFLFFSYLLICIVAGVVLLLHFKIKKLQSMSGYSSQQIGYVHSNAPLLENEEQSNYHNGF